MKKMVNKPVWYFLAIIFFATGYGCNPDDFIRDNQRDPKSPLFNPVIPEHAFFEAEVYDLNHVKLTWSAFSGVEKYQIFRSVQHEQDFVFIDEVTAYNDTTFIDIPDEAGSYYYKVKALWNNETFTSLESNTVLSNLIPGPVFEAGDRVSLSTTFGAPIDDHRVFHASRYENSSQTAFTTLNMDSGEWYAFDFSNFSNLIPNQNHVRSDVFFQLNEDEILLFQMFSRNRTIICSLSQMTCRVTGREIFHLNQWPVNVSFSRLHDNTILITGAIAGGSTIHGNFAYIYDHQEESFTRVSDPLDGVIPSSLTTMPGGDVLACGDIRGSASTSPNTCQIFNASTRSWSMTSQLPKGQNHVSATLLKNGRVFVYGDWLEEVKEARMYDPDSDTWVYSSPSNYAPVHFFTDNVKTGIDYHMFREPLLATASGNILVATLYNETFSHLRNQYFLEEYNPVSDEWVKLYRLPEYVGHLHSITPLGDDRFLIVYRKYLGNQWDQRALFSAIFVHDVLGEIGSLKQISAYLIDKRGFPGFDL